MQRAMLAIVFSLACLPSCKPPQIQTPAQLAERQAREECPIEIDNERFEAALLMKASVAKEVLLKFTNEDWINEPYLLSRAQCRIESTEDDPQAPPYETYYRNEDHKIGYHEMVMIPHPNRCNCIYVASREMGWLTPENFTPGVESCAWKARVHEICGRTQFERASIVDSLLALGSDWTNDCHKKIQWYDNWLCYDYWTDRRLMNSHQFAASD